MEISQAEAGVAALPGLAEWKRTQPAVRDVNKEILEGLTQIERFAVWVTDHVGSMGFFFLILLWTVLWLGWNTLAPAELRFDPGPAFLTWLFVSNVLQIHLMPLIMVGQNLQDRFAELREEEDHRVTLKAEAEVESLLRQLDYQNQLLLEILRRVEAIERSRAG
jgi:uncharacterized membrane protein